MKKIVLSGVEVAVNSGLFIDLLGIQKAADVADDESLRPSLWLVQWPGKRIAEAENSRLRMPSVVKEDGFIFAAPRVAGAYLRAVGSNLEPCMTLEISKMKTDDTKRAQAEARTDNAPSRNSSRAPESTDISPFEFEGKGVRVVVDDGVEWFVAKDLALAVGHARFDSNLIDKVPHEWKGTKPIRTPGGVQPVAVLTEEGVNFFLMRSDKPKAIPLQKWVAGEVLPSIRKTGRYEAPRHESQPPSDALAIAREQHKVVGILLDQVGTLKGSVDELRDGLADARRDIEHIRSGSLRGAAAAPDVVASYDYDAAKYKTPTYILGVKGIGMTPDNLYLLCESAGIVTHEWASGFTMKGGKKTPIKRWFWSLTEAGKKFGINVRNGRSMTRVVLSLEKFEDLLDVVRPHVKPLGIKPLWHPSKNAEKAQEFVKDHSETQTSFDGF